MAANYVLLEKITVGAAGASSVTFSSIPQTGYTDLVVKISARETNNSGVMLAKINGTTTGYTARELIGSGTAASCDTNYVTANGFGPEGSLAWSGVTASVFASNDYYFPNYTSANYKSISVDAVNENNATTVYMGLGAYLWSNTAAITSLSFQPYNSTAFTQYSTFYLYGVAKLGTTPAIVPYATGGDTIMTDGTYWYHAFLSSGTFTPAKGLSCDVLVVAGGGSGGNYRGGGGGAGGLRGLTGQSLASGTGYTVTIGAGGAGRTTDGSGNAGSNSSFNANTATGGGYGAGNTTTGQQTAGGSGGSGGGAGTSASGGAASGGTGTAGQGFAGGNSVTDINGGGGGGAGAVGGNGTGQYAGGAGGVGSSAYSSWGAATGTGQLVSSTYYFAGGGGGYYGAVGGSGGGATSVTATGGTANTGGGGGADNGLLSGGAANGGGSGIVIVRYAV